MTQCISECQPQGLKKHKFPSAVVVYGEAPNQVGINMANMKDGVSHLERGWSSTHTTSYIICWALCKWKRGTLVQKLLRISITESQSIKPSWGPTPSTNTWSHASKARLAAHIREEGLRWDGGGQGEGVPSVGERGLLLSVSCEMVPQGRSRPGTRRQGRGRGVTQGNSFTEHLLCAAYQTLGMHYFI